MKTCTCCKMIKEVSEFGNDKQKADGKYPDCKVCRNKNVKLRNKYRKLYPKPDRCDCCGLVTNDLHVDHDHEDDSFRGYLCPSCNHGIGKLGDNMEGLLRAVNYLNKGPKGKIDDYFNW